MASAPPVNDDTPDDAEFQAEFQRLADGQKPTPRPADEVEAEQPEGNAPVAEPAPAVAPAEAAEDGTSGNEAEGGAPPPPAPAAPDPWEGVSPEVRERIAAIEKERDDARHRAQSDAARVSALSRKLSQVPTASAPAPAARTEPTEAQKALDAKIEQLKEDYPEVAEPMLAMLEAQREQLNAVTGRLAQVDTDRESAILMQQQELLGQAHPDWRDIAMSTEFNEWLSYQPPGIQALTQGMDARETSTALSLFKTEADAQRRAAQPLLATPPAPKPADPRRQQQLDGGREVRSRPAPASSGPPEDYDQAVEFYIAKSEAKRLEQQRR